MATDFIVISFGQALTAPLARTYPSNFTIAKSTAQMTAPIRIPIKSVAVASAR